MGNHWQEETRENGVLFTAAKPEFGSPFGLVLSIRETCLRVPEKSVDMQVG